MAADDLQWLHQSELAGLINSCCQVSLLQPGTSKKPSAKDGFFEGQLTLNDYDASLKRSESYLNLYSLGKMESFLGIDPRASLLAELQDSSFRGNEADDYDQLRLVQNRAWAQETVAAGVKQAKEESKYDDAIALYKKALEIDPTCVDAYVARGAAYANLGRLERAVQDFENALKVDPSHKNAMKYLDATRMKFNEDKLSSSRSQTSKSHTSSSTAPPPSSSSSSMSSAPPLPTLSARAIEKLKEEAESWSSSSRSKSKKDKKKDKKKKSKKGDHKEKDKKHKRSREQSSDSDVEQPSKRHRTGGSDSSPKNNQPTVSVS